MNLANDRKLFGQYESFKYHTIKVCTNFYKSSTMFGPVFASQSHVQILHKKNFNQKNTTKKIAWKLVSRPFVFMKN